MTTVIPPSASLVLLLLLLLRAEGTIGPDMGHVYSIRQVTMPEKALYTEGHPETSAKPYRLLKLCYDCTAMEYAAVKADSFQGPLEEGSLHEV